MIKTKHKIHTFFTNGHSRTILAKKNIAFSLLIKGGSILIGLVMVPITINLISPKQYGVWLTLSSLISWFSFFDIGLGNGLKNKLAETNALDQNNNGKVYISTTYAILTIIALIVFLIFICVNHFINWPIVLNSPNQKGESLNQAALVIVGIFCISFVFQLINTILLATHKPVKSSVIGLIGSSLSLLIVYSLSKCAEVSFIKLVLVLAGIPLFVLIIASIVLFKTSLKEFSPKLHLVNFKYAKELLSIGSVFLIIQIGALVLFQTDNIVITQLFGPKEVTTFNIAYKLFSVIIMIFTIVITPFWSAFTDAYTKNDLNWINDVMRKMHKYWIYLILLTIVLLLVSPFVFKWWLGESVRIPFILSVAMTFYVIGYTWQTIHVFLLNGIGKVRLQLYLVVISALVNIPLAIFFGRIIGLAGITFSNAFLFIIMGIVFSVQCKKILNNEASGIWEK